MANVGPDRPDSDTKAQITREYKQLPATSQFLAHDRGRAGFWETCRLRSAGAVLAIALATFCGTPSARSQSLRSTFDFVYNNGKYTEFAGPLLQNYSINSYYFNLPEIFGNYVGDDFIYSSYASTSLFLSLRSAFVFQFPKANILGVTTAGSNQLGQTVGSYESVQGFIYSNGSFITLDAPGQFTDPYSINDLGQVVGTCGCGPQGPTGFLYSNGEFTLLSFPGAFATELFGINDSGDIVGAYYRYASSQYTTPFVYSQGKYISIPGIAFGAAVGVNDLGDVVGWGSAPVPESSTWAMMLIGLAGLALAGYRRVKAGHVRAALVAGDAILPL